MNAEERGALRRLLKDIHDAIGHGAEAAIRRAMPGGRVPTSAGGTGTTQGAQPPLPVPGDDGQILHGDADGTLYWADEAGAVTTRWDVLTDGDLADPQIIFAGGQVVMVEVPL